MIHEILDLCTSFKYKEDNKATFEKVKRIFSNSIYEEGTLEPYFNELLDYFKTKELETLNFDSIYDNIANLSSLDSNYREGIIEVLAFFDLVSTSKADDVFEKLEEILFEAIDSKEFEEDKKANVKKIVRSVDKQRLIDELNLTSKKSMNNFIDFIRDFYDYNGKFTVEQMTSFIDLLTDDQIEIMKNCQ